ncbi:MAG: TlpA disulfide reductase family protein, partial [Marinifilaceae bacterium]
MKKMRMFLLAYFVIITSSLFAQKETTIQGTLNSKIKERVFLHTIKEGQMYEYASTNVTPNGEFGFIIKPNKEQPYIIGTRNYKNTIWIKPGEHIQIELNSAKIKFKGKISKENNALEEWANATTTVKEKTIYAPRPWTTFTDFFQDLDTLQQASKTYLTRLKSKNEVFTTFARNMVKFDLFYYPLHFLLAPRAKHPTSKQYHALYNIDSKELFHDNSILAMPYGLDAIRLYPKFVALKENKILKTEEVLATIPCKQIQGEHLINEAKNMTFFEQYKEMYITYKAYITTHSQQSRLESIGNRLYTKELDEKNKESQKATNFTYPDRNGKMISLSDFKGKVVVVDVWAGWCAPCRKEIPYFSKLEKEFREKDVVFIGISVDEEKFYEK